MGMFRNTRREPAVTVFLRHMERGRFLDAAKALRHLDGAFTPPPHALWRLGRWCLDKEKPKFARQPLQVFLDTFPNHLDRPAVMRDMALTLAMLGKRAEATEWATQAEEHAKQLEKARRQQHEESVFAAGKARQFADNKATA